MEATQEKFDGHAQWGGNRFSDVSSTVMDICNKQMSLAFGFYNNLFNSFPGMNKTGWMNGMNFFNPVNTAENFGNMFSGIHLFKMNERFACLSSEQSEEMRKQMMELGNLWRDTIQKQFHGLQENRNRLSKKISELAEENLKNRTEAFNSIFEAFNKQIDLSIELNRKFMEELNHQCHEAVNRNEKFYSEVIKTPQDNSSVRTEKAHTAHLAKKQAKPEHTHAANHNHNHNHHKH